MEFLLIMGIGTLLAVWAVIASRPKRPTYLGEPPSHLREFVPRVAPSWKKDIALSHPDDELEYLEAIERYDRDPQHQPFPFPPPTRPKEENAD